MSLRTPLNSILGFADLLKDATGGGARRRSSPAMSSNILQSGRALLELINDLLDLAKIEAGQNGNSLGAVIAWRFVRGLENILKPLCEPRQLVIDVSVANNIPILQTDPGKLQQVLYNLLSNAIKFSPNGSAIDLTAVREGEDQVRIAVTDRGEGIAVNKQQIIFEKFRQVDAWVTRTHSGSGLGTGDLKRADGNCWGNDRQSAARPAKGRRSGSFCRSRFSLVRSTSAANGDELKIVFGFSVFSFQWERPAENWRRGSSFSVFSWKRRPKTENRKLKTKSEFFASTSSPRLRKPAHRDYLGGGNSIRADPQ